MSKPCSQGRFQRVRTSTCNGSTLSTYSNARIAGMQKELKLTGNRYNWLLTIFYISYILFEPLTLMWKVVPPHMWCAFVVLCWGLIATLQSATQSWVGEMACRFFLGIFEAGFGPGIPYLLSFFYLRHELGLRCGIFLAAAPLANCFAGVDSLNLSIFDRAWLNGC